MVVGVTGHRSNKLWGYDYSDYRYINLKNMFITLLKNNNITDAWTGMAVGVDTIFALAVLELKESGMDIKLHCAIPCRNQEKLWPIEAQELYNSILDRADEVILVSDDEYSPKLMQIRNEYIVDRIDTLIAVWNGYPVGGTWNCVNYARGVGKDIFYIDPALLQEVHYVFYS